MGRHIPATFFEHTMMFTKNREHGVRETGPHTCTDTFVLLALDSKFCTYKSCIHITVIIEGNSQI